MTGRHDATLQTLRLKYNAALSAHQSCARALTEAGMAGAGVDAELAASEAKARQELNQARDRLLAAMTESMTGQPLAEPSRDPPHHRTGPPDDS